MKVKNINISENLLERFLRYVKIDTQSDPNSISQPSTSKQFDLLQLLKDELYSIGVTDITLDKNGYLIAHIPPSQRLENIPKICFCSHVDTSPEFSGKNINPQVINNYDGEDIILGNSGHILSPRKFENLKDLVGHTIITTDGNTLLGADDKAGIAEIMTAMEVIIKGNIKHGPIRLCFTPDEEIGRGMNNIDLERLDSDVAYTMDGSKLGDLEYECFNAASVKLSIKGLSIHPGYAKDKMVNAIEIFNKFHNLLPEKEKPEYTEDRQGFFHITNVEGSIEALNTCYIVRDFDKNKFEERKTKIKNIVEYLNSLYGEDTLSLEIKDSYYNMAEKILPYPKVLDIAKKAIENIGVKYTIRPIRGGTDGARLSYMGVPCPNIFTGGTNFHGRYEYVSLDVMCCAVRVIENIISLWAEPEIK